MRLYHQQRRAPEAGRLLRRHLRGRHPPAVEEDRQHQGLRRPQGQERGDHRRHHLRAPAQGHERGQEDGHEHHLRQGPRRVLHDARIRPRGGLHDGRRAALRRNGQGQEAGRLGRRWHPQSFEIYGCMVRKGDAAFKKVVDKAITDTYASGEVNKIYDKWFTQPIPPKGLNLNFPMSEELKKLIASPTDKAAEQM
ncbi:transporter substrate-binding domain-containing protein [Pseudomonas aeruginosa]